MTMDTALHSGLHGISLLFSYPDQQWAAAQLPLEAEPEAAKLLTEMRNANPWDIEAEYVRLFINAMPEVPCAPYGSVYLEGAVMGKTTVKVAGIFHYYGLNTEDLLITSRLKLNFWPGCTVVRRKQNSTGNISAFSSNI